KDRGHVFHYDGHCERTDVVYDAPIKRYLLAVSFGHGKGWGIFDAPTPWGPWSTAYLTRDWGLGHTHGYRIPTKWITVNGTDMWLVFSGTRHLDTTYDAFCVRGMHLDCW